MFTRISNDIKEEWRMKNLEARRRLNMIDTTQNTIDLSNGLRASVIK